MKQLSAKQFERARSFITAHARPVDRALFMYHFENGSAQGVLDALAHYQNDDGGFGHGLEPDFQTPASSVLATTVAFQYLHEIGATANDVIVRRGITYLLASYDSEHQWWLPVPPQVEDAPHAPWWDYHAQIERMHDVQGWANPCTEVVGYLHAYQQLVPPQFLEDVTQLAMTHLHAMPEAIEMHALVCVQRMVQMLPEPHRRTAWEKVRRAVPLVVETRPEQWASYSLPPLIFAPTPTSPVADLLDEPIQLNLDYLIEQQSPDGSWTPNWSWGEHAEGWQRAEREWRGYLTVQALKQLRDWERIEKYHS